MIRCTDVHKSYQLGDRAVHALVGVDLHITEPGYYAIMGQSGSGKSTLLHLLGALDKPDRGEIVIAGKSLHTISERDANMFRREQIGIVFQQYNLIPTLTAQQNVELPGMLAGKTQRELNKLSGPLLERLGLTDRANHRPDALSGGEQQRVAIARALLYSPPILLADEPTGNLDSASSDILWSLLGEVAREHDMTVLMITHEPAAAAHCQRVFLLADGRIQGQIDTEGLDAAGVATRYLELAGSA